MRIAVPVEENEKDICPSFGRTPLFYIYDTDTKEGHFIDNDAMNAPAVPPPPAGSAPVPG